MRQRCCWIFFSSLKKELKRESIKHEK